MILSEWPTKKYSSILADPPWHFSTWGERPWWHRAEDVDLSKSRVADRHYKTMKVEGIKELPVSEVAADDCMLFLWATYPTLLDAIATLEAWGFKYKTVAFTWAKTTKNGKWHCGLGYYTRANPEICLLGTRGKPKRVSKAVRNLVVSQVREHSRKPDEVRASIEQLVTGPYLELFSRTDYAGWDVWGLEAGKYAQEADL